VKGLSSHAQTSAKRRCKGCQEAAAAGRSIEHLLARSPRLEQTRGPWRHRSPGSGDRTFGHVLEGLTVGPWVQRTSSARSPVFRPWCRCGPDQKSKQVAASSGLGLVRWPARDAHSAIKHAMAHGPVDDRLVAVCSKRAVRPRETSIPAVPVQPVDGPLARNLNRLAGQCGLPLPPGVNPRSKRAGPNATAGHPEW